ncbi:hypothetical protein CV093_08990 [Oceanobacillus sp. 143]|uniref:Peptidyl-prolyl cis-trans isomerase n=1 Tax=Oceanobacillus zhaokaii TaxID=2052660 RepID=A0A345PG33_9BACI|nr:hypothetical protein [Oceanobacillus zhaokaii]AXI08963.1 hypothetical protein CUC15_08550 [Oceanobacillus zhaokaii]QGS68597.1 hypothetical protein CV093_08990 [Oceanobacillus sp. 143]
MIVPITGKVNYSITLDPTVWIFDDRKIKFEEAFNQPLPASSKNNELEEASQRWERAINPPVNKGITRLEGEEILKHSYVMPIKDFIRNAEIQSDAVNAILVINDDQQDTITITLKELEDSYLQFAMNGKPLKDGPVYFFYQDGSNKDNPIKNVKKIIIN